MTRRARSRILEREVITILELSPRRASAFRGRNWAHLDHTESISITPQFSIFLFKPYPTPLVGRSVGWRTDCHKRSKGRKVCFAQRASSTSRFLDGMLLAFRLYPSLLKEASMKNMVTRPSHTNSPPYFTPDPSTRTSSSAGVVERSRQRSRVQRSRPIGADGRSLNVERQWMVEQAKEPHHTHQPEKKQRREASFRHDRAQPLRPSNRIGRFNRRITDFRSIQLVGVSGARATPSYRCAKSTSNYIEPECCNEKRFDSGISGSAAVSLPSKNPASPSNTPT